MNIRLGDIEKYSRDRYLESFECIKNGTIISAKDVTRRDMYNILVGIRYFRKKYSLQIKNILNLHQMIDSIIEISEDVKDVKIMAGLQKQLFYNREYRDSEDTSSSIKNIDRQVIISHINDLYEKVSGDTQTNLEGDFEYWKGNKFHVSQYWKDLYDTVLSGQVWQGVIKNPKENKDDFNYVHTTIVPIMGKNNSFETFIVLKFDITAFKELEKVMVDSRNRLHNILNSTSQGFWVINEKLEIQDINDAFCNMIGYTRDEILGKSIYDFFDSENRRILEKQTYTICDTEHRTYDVKLRRKDGTNLPIKLQATTIRNEQGEITDIIAFMVDVSDLVEVSKKDALTGISNRRHFDSEIKKCYTSIQEGDLNEISLAMIDIDHFKNINDTYGHPVGDLVLEKMGTFLRHISDKNLSVFRYGGEEFMLIGRNIDIETMKILLEEFRIEIEGTKIFSDDKTIRFTISGGVVNYKQGDAYNNTPERITKLVDTCLYHAKNDGRNCIKSRRDI